MRLNLSFNNLINSIATLAKEKFTGLNFKELLAVKFNCKKQFLTSSSPNRISRSIGSRNEMFLTSAMLFSAASNDFLGVFHIYLSTTVTSFCLKEL